MNDHAAATCGTCIHFARVPVIVVGDVTVPADNPAAAIIGECRRYAPHGGKWRWPDVVAQDGCGEHDSGRSAAGSARLIGLLREAEKMALSAQEFGLATRINSALRRMGQEPNPIRSAAEQSEVGSNELLGADDRSEKPC